MKRCEETKEQVKRCFCPYCDEEIAISAAPYCQPCIVTLHYCAVCQIAVPREVTVCPQCGGELEWK